MRARTPGYFRRLPSPRFYAWAFVLTLFGVRMIGAGQGSATPRQLDTPPMAGACDVVAVLTGDTFLVRQPHLPQPVRVRLLSTQADSTNAAATDFARDFIASGNVRLRMDNHRLTQRGEYLAYVEVHGETLNEALLAAGGAKFVQFPGNSGSMDRRMREAQETAKRREVGIWQK